MLRKGFFILLISGMTIYTPGSAQSRTPVAWSFDVHASGRGEVTVTSTATMNDGWHIYSRFLDEGGPLPTEFAFDATGAYVLVGKMREEGNLVERYDSTFLMPVAWFEGRAIFKQRVRLKTASATIKGKVLFMACNDQQCLPPREVAFQLDAGRAISEPLPRKEGERKTRAASDHGPSN